jgi:protein TonB
LGTQNDSHPRYPGKDTLKNDAFGIALIWSLAIHICAIMTASTFLHTSRLHREDFLPVRLVELPPAESPSTKETETIAEVKKAPPAALKSEKPEAPKPQTAKAPGLRAELPGPSTAVKEEPAKPIETKPGETAKLGPPPSYQSDSPVEGGGNAAGAGNLSDKGNIGVVPGAGTAEGGGGTASSGLGRGSGAPGLPAQGTPYRSNREAKPIQTARAVYPPMALRAGLESDVILKIEVNAEGRVTKAEVTKSGGGGFDEEALKAVKQSRFEPAHRDGQPVAAEFTYIYRFRLRR